MTTQSPTQAQTDTPKRRKRVSKASSKTSKQTPADQALTIDMALNCLGLEPGYDLLKLKEFYRAQVKVWHPDIRHDDPELAHTRMQRINEAYDLLAGLLPDDPKGRQAWASMTAERREALRLEFRSEWVRAYHRACSEGNGYGGLHLLTCIKNFERAHLPAPAGWFLLALHPDTPVARQRYRDWLLSMAPNRSLAEPWARRYHNLEFGQGSWTFYLPGTVGELSGDRRG